MCSSDPEDLGGSFETDTGQGFQKAKPVEVPREPDPLSDVSKDLKERRYEDSDLMPFGKHKGLRLDEVPNSYLLWLYDQRPISDRRLELYIKFALDP
jgi:hypothetical protein